MSEGSERPTKRQKTVSTGDLSHKQSNEDVLTQKQKSSKGKYISNVRTKKPADDSIDKRADSGRTFSQPSVICAGDKGIFVTCDKGREKKSLLETHDLVLEDLARKQSDTGLQEEASHGRPTGDGEADSIEADIAAELDSMRDNGSTVGLNSASKPMQLITLDVPCVSFLRFPSGSELDPVEIVHRICMNAADKATPQQSRYIKRLTPLCSLGKTLSQGLLKACDGVLPGTFGPNDAGMVKSVKFAIRPTFRNNDKLERDEVIKVVADRVQELGNGLHKVDLKHYEKGIIVEVYRAWVGMSVVDNVDNGKFKLGFETLKRFNLAEIYANR